MGAKLALGPIFTSWDIQLEVPTLRLTDELHEPLEAQLAALAEALELEYTNAPVVIGVILSFWGL